MAGSKVKRKKVHMYNHIYAYLYNDPADSLDQEMKVTSVQGSLDHEKKEQSI